MSTRIRTGVKALIVHEGKILVVKEKVMRNGKEVVIHDFPGGGIESGETLRDALHREVWEEVGLKIAIGRPVGGWDFMLRASEKLSEPDAEELVHIVCVGFQCSVVGDVQVDTTKNPAQEDIFDVVWVTPEQILQDPEFFAHEDIRESVRNVVDSVVS